MKKYGDARLGKVYESYLIGQRGDIRQNSLGGEVEKQSKWEVRFSSWLNWKLENKGDETSAWVRDNEGGIGRGVNGSGRVLCWRYLKFWKKKQQLGRRPWIRHLLWWMSATRKMIGEGGERRDWHVSKELRDPKNWEQDCGIPLKLILHERAECTRWWHLSIGFL